MSERPRRRRVLVGIKVLTTVGLMAWLGARMIQRDGVEVLLDRLSSLHAGWLAFAVALHFLAVLAGVSRWRLLLRAADLELPFADLLRSFLVGRFVGAFTPSTTGLDGWRLYDVGRATGAMGRSAAVIVVEKLVGLLGMALVCAALVPFGGVELMGSSAIGASLGLAACAALGLFLMRRPRGLAALASRLPKRLRVSGDKVIDALAKSHLDRGQLLGAVGRGVVSHLALSSVFLATALAVGVDAPWTTVMVVGNAIVLAVLLPVSIGGVGVREGVAVLLLAGAGVSSTDAVLIALLGYLTGQVPALLGGLAMMGSRQTHPQLGVRPAESTVS